MDYLFTVLPTTSPFLFVLFCFRSTCNSIFTYPFFYKSPPHRSRPSPLLFPSCVTVTAILKSLVSQPPLVSSILSPAPSLPTAIFVHVTIPISSRIPSSPFFAYHYLPPYYPPYTIPFLFFSFFTYPQFHTAETFQNLPHAVLFILFFVVDDYDFGWIYVNVYLMQKNVM